MAIISKYAHKILNVKFRPGTGIHEEPFLGNNRQLIEGRKGSMHYSIPKDSHLKLDRLVPIRDLHKFGLIDPAFLNQNSSDPQSPQNRKKKWVKIYVKTEVTAQGKYTKYDNIKVQWSIAISDFANFTGIIGLPFYPIKINDWAPLHYVPGTYQFRRPMTKNPNQLSESLIYELSIWKLINFQNETLKTIRVPQIRDDPKRKYIILLINKQEILEIIFPCKNYEYEDEDIIF